MKNFITNVKYAYISLPHTKFLTITLIDSVIGGGSYRAFAD